MRWIVLAWIVLAEAALLLILIQAMAKWLHAWLRWPLWLLLVAGSAAAAGSLLTRRLSDGEHFLSLTAPFVTLRYFVFVAVATVPASFFSIGAASLLRWRDGGLKLLRWPVGWRHSGRLLLLSCCGVVVTAALNDWLVCRALRALDQRSRQLAPSVKPPDCPNEENAAPIYLEVGAKPELSDKGLPDFSKDKRQLLEPAWQQYFERNTTLTEKVRTASLLPSCLFEKDWSDANPIAVAPETGPLQACVRVLAWEGLAAALQGEIALALNDAAALRRMAEQLCADPRGVHHLLARLAEESAVNVIEAALFVRPLTLQETAALAHREGFEFRQCLVPFCTWEEAEQYQMISQAYLGTAITNDDYKLPLHRQMTAVILFRNRLIHAADDLTSMPLIFSDLKRRCSYRYDETIPQEVRPLPGGATITDRMQSVYSLLRAHVHADEARTLADFGLDLVSKGLVERILHEGPDIVPPSQRPLDARDRQPIRITVKDGGVLLYCVGWNGRDDGGDELEWIKGDLTFCFGDAFKARRLTPIIDEPTRE